MVEGGRRRDAALGPAAQAAVQRAWNARDTDPAAAATDYARLAKMAGDRGMHNMHVHMAVEAARARYRAASGGDMADAEEQVAAGLAAANLAGNVQRSARRFSALVAELREHGQADVADKVEGDARTRLSLSALPAARLPIPLNRSQRRTLPNGCPVCGGDVDYDVMFNDDGTAECRYCGSNLK